MHVSHVNMLIDLCSYFWGFELTGNPDLQSVLHALNSFRMPKRLLVYQLYNYDMRIFILHTEC